MSRCPECAVTIEGRWEVCPLCGTPVVGEPDAVVMDSDGPDSEGQATDDTGEPDPYPAVPLRFSRRKVMRNLVWSSLGVIVASLATQLLFGHENGSVGVLRSVWLGLIVMWLLVITAVNQRRNVARTALYLVVIVGLVSVYWDYLSGWHWWSLTYAVPAMCACSAIALAITVRVMRIAPHDHVVFSGVVLLLGLAPLVFLPLGWVSVAWPAVLCGGLSVLMLILLQVVRGREVRHELARYLHV